MEEKLDTCEYKSNQFTFPISYFVMSVIPIEEILKYVNHARTDPQSFANHVSKQINAFINDKELPLVPGCNYRVNESKKAWLQCKAFLQKQKAIHPLKLSEALNMCAQDHAHDLASYGIFDHNGSDGSDLTSRVKRRCGTRGMGTMSENLGQQFMIKGRNHALQTVMGLIIDDGVPNRGHRKNIFSTQTNYIGICSKVQGDKIITVMDFHSEDLPLKNGANKGQKSDVVNEINYKQNKKKCQKVKGFGDFGKLIQNIDDRPIGKCKGSRFVISKSTSTCTSIVNGKKTVKKTEKLQYNDGTIEQNEHIETTI